MLKQRSIISLLQDDQSPCLLLIGIQSAIDPYVKIPR